MSRRSRSISTSSSDEASDYKDESWRDEDFIWSKRTVNRYISFKWNSGCGSGKPYVGQIQEHNSCRENRKRVDYLVIRVDGEDHGYKLGKDIRHFTLYADIKCSKCVGEWGKEGWSFHKDESDVSKTTSPKMHAVKTTRNFSLASEELEISNSFCGGIASKTPDFYFYRSAAEICGRKGSLVLSPTQTRE